MATAVRGWDGGMKKPAPALTAIEPPGPHVIIPTALYWGEDLRRHLGLSEHALRRERRAGRLRVARVLGCYCCLGEWLLEWVRGRELPRPGKKS